MQEINNIKNIEITLDIFNFEGVYMLVGGLILIYVSYLVFNKILKLNNIRKQNILDKINRQEYIKQEKGKIYNAILVLSENMEEMGKDEYYTDLNYLFRRYFVYLGIINAYKMTLKELQSKKIDKKILDIFTQSYINEFSESKDTTSIRKQISMNFMIYLKK